MQIHPLVTLSPCLSQPWREGDMGWLDSRPHSYPGRETEAWGCPLWTSLAPPCPPPQGHAPTAASASDLAGTLRGASRPLSALPAPPQGGLPRAP